MESCRPDHPLLSGTCLVEAIRVREPSPEILYPGLMNRGLSIRPDPSQLYGDFKRVGNTTARRVLIKFHPPIIPTLGSWMTPTDINHYSTRAESSSQEWSIELSPIQIKIIHTITTVLSPRYYTPQPLVFSARLINVCRLPLLLRQIGPDDQDLSSYQAGCW